MKFYNPALTTVRQPLARMESVPAATLLRRIAEPAAHGPAVESVEGELIERESTGPAPQ